MKAKVIIMCKHNDNQNQENLNKTLTPCEKCKASEKTYVCYDKNTGYKCVYYQKPNPKPIQILSDNQLKVVLNAISTFGIETQQDMAIQEMSELTQAILKFRLFTQNSKANTNGKLLYNNLIEEIADVIITLQQIILMFDDIGNNITVQEVINQKIDRLEKSIKNI